MAIAWFICPYKRRLSPRNTPSRYPAMQDFQPLITGDGGDWAESEVLGDRAVVKVRASETTLTAIGNGLGFRRIPLRLLNESVSSLPPATRAAIRDELLDAGYTLGEVDSRFPDIADATLGDVLRFLATRRIKVRLDQGTDSFVFDGPVQPCRSIDDVDQVVTE